MRNTSLFTLVPVLALVGCSQNVDGDFGGPDDGWMDPGVDDGMTTGDPGEGGNSSGGTDGGDGDDSAADDDLGDDEDSDGDDADSGDSSGGEGGGDEDSGGEDSGDDGDDGSDGCGQDYPSGDHSLTIDVAGTTRQYLFIVPPNYDSDEPYPLIFALHGRAGDGPGLRRYFSMESRTNGGAIHVYPSGLDQSWDLSGNGVDVQFFDAMLQFARENTCIDAERIFVYGYSMGGMFSNLLGCVRGDEIRAIGPMAGSGPNGGNCVGQVASIMSHGTDDPTVSYDWGVGSRDHWLEANGCSNTTQPFVTPPCEEYEGCDSGYPVVWCEHSGMGHSPANYFTEAAWNFFSQF